MGSSLLVDANLLVLWAVGAVSPALIARHKRLNAYVENDYKVLSDFMAGYDSIAVTPNALSEASNIARYIAEPARSKVAMILARIAETSKEFYVPSARAVARNEYRYLGLTDAAMLEVMDVHLLTDDLDLLVAAESQGKTCFYFTHLREAAGITS